MTIVVSVDDGSIQILAAELAQRLAVRRLTTDVCRASAERYNVGFRGAARAAVSDLAFVRALRRERGILHFPSHHLARYGPFCGRPYVVTVHDLMRQFDRRHPDVLIHRPTPRDRALLELDVVGIRRASAIIAVSQTTKAALVTHLGLDPARIHVVHPGIDRSVFAPVSVPPPPDPYVLYVGSEQPRKNLAALLGALRELRRDPRHGNLRLIKVGDPGGAEAPFRARTLARIRELGLDGAVQLTGRVSHPELLALYSGATCLVQPSLYEGFGLPPLEAMACGCPVVVSDRAALPEISGPAANVTAPRPERLARAIRRVIEDEEVRRRLVQAGFDHVRRFSWERSAAATMAVYDRVAYELGRPGRSTRASTFSSG